MLLSLGKASNFADITKVVELPWEEVTARFAKTPPESDDKASAGWYCPAEFKPVYRDSKNLVARYALTFDYDHIDQWDLTEIKSTYAKYAYVMYTTASHTKDKPRVRVLFPLSRPATMDEFCAVTRMHGARFDIERLAAESHTPAQMMFLPTKKPGGEFWAEINEGAIVDVDCVLGEYDDWTDRTQWPRRAQGDSVHHTAESATAPLEKLGVVGDFNRAYRITEAIERFNLPYVPGSNGRYTYTSGSRPDGLRLYDDDTKAHSEHDTDPARGQSNAFDLVRLHRFGALDTPEVEALPITERPSYKAMCKLALEQPEVRAAVLSADFVDLGPLLPPIVESERVGEEEHEPDKKGLRVVPAKEFATSKPIQWIIKGVLPRAEIAVIYGASTSGKSFLALDMCFAVALGKPWRDKRVTPGRVVYLCAEGAEGFRRRLAGFAARNSIVLPDTIGVIGAMPSFLEVDDVKTVIKAVREWSRGADRTDLIVVDTLSAVTPGGDENSGKDLGRAVDHCKSLHRHTGALVALIHHSGKDASKGARGWSGLRAAADAEIEVARNEEVRVAKISKQKDGSDGEKFWFKLDVVELGADEDGEQSTTCVVVPTDPPEGKGSRLTPAQQTAFTTIKLELSGAADGRVGAKEMVRRLAESWSPPADGRDTRGQRANRMLDALVANGSIVMHRGIVSLHTAVETSMWEDE